MVGEMSVRGNVLVGKCPVGEVSFGEVSGRGSVRRGSVSQGFALGEVSVGKCSVVKLSYNQKMYGVIKGENKLYEKKTVNRSCHYEFVETLRKRNFPSRQVFIPDL